jgi:pSer/pThr/pTyr-binding forkhead associated (FHA) protein
MPTLTHKHPDGNDRTLTFADKPLVIGRLLDSDIPVRDSFMSRVHCGIGFANNQFTLKDLGSTNGTYRNGARVFECPLASGDKIQVGNTTLVFEIDTATGNAVLRQVTKLTAAPKITLGPPVRPLSPGPVTSPKLPGGAPPVAPPPGLRKV